MQLNNYFNFENGVKVFFTFSILFAFSIPYIIEGDLIYEIQKGNLMVFFEMLGPIPESLISDTFTLDLMFWSPRGVELLLLLLVTSISYIIWYKYKEYSTRAMLCNRCGEISFSERYFFHNPEDKEYPMCLDCYYEVYGQFDDEYEKIRNSEEERNRWAAWGREEVVRRKEGIAYRKKAREEIKVVVKIAMDKMKTLKEEEDKYVEDYDDYREEEEGIDTNEIGTDDEIDTNEIGTDDEIDEEFS